jgi:hypothetical protein
MTANEQRMVGHAAHGALVHCGARRPVDRGNEADVEQAGVQRAHPKFADDDRLGDAIDYAPLRGIEARLVDLKLRTSQNSAAARTSSRVYLENREPR